MTVRTVGFNDVTASVNGVLHANVIALVIMQVYGAVRMEGILALLLAYMGAVQFTTYGMLARSYGEVNAMSKALLEAVRRTTTADPVNVWGRVDAIIQRQIRSMPKLCVKGGSSFYYDKPLLLTMLDVILAQSVGLLMMR